MTERLADITARIDGVRQLGAVVNAIRAIAATRARQARDELVAVDSYAATIATAIRRALEANSAPRSEDARRSGRAALVVFCAEQGFAGAFSERVLDFVGAERAPHELFLVGARGASLAAERGVAAAWKIGMPPHTLGIPRLADRIAEALYRNLAAGRIDRLEAIFTQWRPALGASVARRALLPRDLTAFPPATGAVAPLLNLAPEALLRDLAAEYVHAQLCNAALHAFAAESEARMEAMAAARRHIERELAALEATQRSVRQEEITAEIIELAAGETASRADAR